MKAKNIFRYKVVISTNELIDLVEIKPQKECPATYSEIIELLERAKKIMEEKKSMYDDAIPNPCTINKRDNNAK